jgi:hypothetical protein
MLAMNHRLEVFAVLVIDIDIGLVANIEINF